MDICKFMAILVYEVSSRTARTVKQSEFQESQDNTEKLCLQKNKTSTTINCQEADAAALWVERLPS